MSSSGDAQKNNPVNIDIRDVHKPTLKNIQLGYVVIIGGFRLMTSVMTIIEYAQILGDPYPHFHPCYSDYWTTAYRWMYRYVKL
ncbi:hypothetical protein HF086_003316 [Spodoptera exigua]|uniref:Uncharacterized protein n=1 Tax=Spodoptera exigua TaxID=7107 RepID=A0A922SPJ1_SPOEX|nr:hypothetical protein HF086_003316 [Spodoptera exigua]